MLQGIRRIPLSPSLPRHPPTPLRPAKDTQTSVYCTGAHALHALRCSCTPVGCSCTAEGCSCTAEGCSCTAEGARRTDVGVHMTMVLLQHTGADVNKGPDKP